MRHLQGPLLPTVVDVDHARDVWHGVAAVHGAESDEASFAWANWRITAEAMLRHAEWRRGFIDSAAELEVPR